MKKNVPLSVLKAIEPIINNIKPGELIAIRNPSKVFKVLDGEAGSDFYFELVSVTKQSANAVAVELIYKPASENITSEFKTTIGVEQVGAHFNKWYGLLEGYQKVKSVFDDPILKKYEEEFYAKFESADEDADTASFPLEQQWLLDETISKISSVIEEKKEIDKGIVSNLLKEASAIQASITVSTKNENLKSFSAWLAKIQKTSLRLIKDVYPIILQDFMGGVLKGLLP